MAEEQRAIRTKAILTTKPSHLPALVPQRLDHLHSRTRRMAQSPSYLPLLPSFCIDNQTYQHPMFAANSALMRNLNHQFSQVSIEQATGLTTVVVCSCCEEGVLTVTYLLLCNGKPNFHGPNLTLMRSKSKSSFLCRSPQCVDCFCCSMAQQSGNGSNRTLPHRFHRPWPQEGKRQYVSQIDPIFNDLRLSIKSLQGHKYCQGAETSFLIQ